jgi:hypothetical protein
VHLGDVIIHILGYADDAALIDYGDAEGLARAEKRVSSVAKGSREDADMMISIPKTKVLHVRTQEEVSATTGNEARSVCKFTCPHLHCGFQFHNRRGLLVHAGRCEWRNEFKIDRIVASKGPVFAKQFKIRWAGFSEEEDSWEPRSGLHPETIKEYEKANGEYAFQWPHRCNVCDLPCRTKTGIKIHKAKIHKVEKDQEFADRLMTNQCACRNIQDYRKRDTQYTAKASRLKTFSSLST